MYILKECIKCPIFTIGTHARLTETTGAVLFVVAGVNNADVLAVSRRSRSKFGS